MQETTGLDERTAARLGVGWEQIADFARRWRMQELALFGSVLRDDFHENSDIDVLIVFVEQHGWDLFELVKMQDELEQLFGRKVDWLQRKELRNPYRRRTILRTARTIYGES